MVNDKLVLIRLTKCGGTSFENIMKIQKLPIIKYTPTRENVEKYNKAGHDKQFHFSIIRNPYDKAVSAYKWLTVGNGKDRLGKLKKIIPNNVPFYDFLLLYQEYKLRYIEHNCIVNKSGAIYPQNNDKKDPKSTDYFWWMQHLEGMYESIASFIDPQKIDHFVKLENYYNDLKEIESRVGVKINLRHDNKTRENNEYKSFYNEKIYDLVNSIYEKDVLFFKYIF